MPAYLDYIIVAFFAAFLGWRYVQTRATGHLWFLLPLVLVLGLSQGWANRWGEGFFVFYRIATLGSVVLAVVMYWRDYRRRNAAAIEANKKRKAQEEQARQKTKDGKERREAEARKETQGKKKTSGKKK